MDCRAKTVPVDIGETCLVLDNELRNVDRAEVAGLVRQERLLATRVCRRDAAKVKDRAVPVDLVKENHSGLAIAPCAINNLAEHLARVQPVDLYYLAVEVCRVGKCAKRVGRAVLHRLHELVGSADRDIEVVDLTLDLLAIDEFENVGVVNIEHGHVRTVTLATLCYEGRDRRQVSQHGDRPTGFAMSGPDAGVLRPEGCKGKAGATAIFLHHCGIVSGTHDPLHAVIEGEHETGRQRPCARAGVHQRGRVWQILQAGHHLVEILFEFRHLAGGLFVL